MSQDTLILRMCARRAHCPPDEAELWHEVAVELVGLRAKCAELAERLNRPGYFEANKAHDLAWKMQQERDALQRFIDSAFLAHPNLDMDIAALREKP